MVQDQGAGFTAIKRNQLASLEIPASPAADQRWIVARIEEITRRVEETRHLHQELHSQLEKVIPAVLSIAFRGEL